MQKLNWSAKTKLEKAGLKASKLLTKAGFQSFWVGGIVRNMLLKLPSDNIDIATSATPNEIEKVFKQIKFKTVPIGKEFGSILVIIDGEKIEITTFRRDGKSADRRHPDFVDFVQDYIQDASRRDFTINAFYFDPISKFVYDPTNGMKDLKGKILRFIGDARERIDEDYLRMLRAVRLSTQLQFRIEDRSYSAIKHRVKHIQSISGERVKAELDKIIISPKAGDGIRLLEQIGLLKYICPELDKLKTIFHKSKRYHLEGHVLNHSILVMEALKIKTLNQKYTALFHDVGKISTGKKVVKDGESVISFKGHVDISGKIFESFANKYKFPRKDREEILWLIARHDAQKHFLKFDNTGQIMYASHKLFPYLVDIWQADVSGNIITVVNKKYQKSRFKANIIAKKIIKRITNTKRLTESLAQGDLIMKYKKIPPGKNLGTLIANVRAQIILGEIKNILDLKKYLTNV
jgi:tRNA nucleotidyltransferase/poly(A) polymerase